MNFPPLCVLLLTYERTKYAVLTVQSLLKNFNYSGNWGIHIADDGSDLKHTRTLQREAIGFLRGLSITQRGGYGQNYNLALQSIHTWADIILPLEDDWELTRPLSADPLVLALQENQFGCIRMGYLGWTQELRGKIISAAGQQFLLLDPDSPEPHVWAGHPRLETKEWQRSVGPWPEGDYDPGTTEFMVAHRREAREGVVWPLDLQRACGDLWVHIGAVQARTDQRQAVEA